MLEYPFFAHRLGSNRKVLTRPTELQGTDFFIAMNGFYIEVTNNLLEEKHVKSIGSALWEFLWCLDKITKIDENGLGYVLGGKPIKREEIKTNLGKSVGHISENLNKLVKAGYINLKRTPYGLIITVNKAKKRYSQKATSNITKRQHLQSEKATSIIDKTVRQDSKTITNVIKEFGNPLINEVSKYFLETMQIPKEDCTQRQSRQYWYLLLKESKMRVASVKWLIDLASKDEFYKSNITSSKDLYYKRVKIISRKRGEHDGSRVSIDITKI